MKLNTLILRFVFLICSMQLLTSCFSRVYLKRVMPADKIEPIPTNPSPQYAWVTGHYKYSQSGYQLVNGNYQPIPLGKTSWVEGRYARRAGRYKYAHSYWQ